MDNFSFDVSLSFPSSDPFLTARAWCGRFEAYDAVRTRKQHVRRTMGRLWNNKLSRVWQKWQEVVGEWAPRRGGFAVP